MSRDSSTFTAPPATLLLAIAVGGAVILANALLILAREARRLLRWHSARHAVSEQRGEAEADAFVGAIHGARDDEWAYLQPAFEQFPSTAFRSSFEPPWEPAEPPAHPAPTMVPLQGPSPRLPELTPAELDEIKARFLAAQGGPVEVLPPEPEPEPGLPAAALEIPPEQDRAWREMVALGQELQGEPEPDLRPAWLQKMEPHADTDDAVDSILHRVLSPELLARLDAAKAAAK